MRLMKMLYTSLMLLLVLTFLRVAGAGVFGSPGAGQTGASENSTPGHSTKFDPKDVRFSRNMVNTADKNIPTEWSVQEGARKNIKWAVQIGKTYPETGYLPPAIAAGKVFVATNNRVPSDPNVKDPKKAVLKCFRESDGQFLWQIVHNTAPPEVAEGPGGSSDSSGLLTTPFVDGDRLHYVTPAAEVICADMNGQIIWRYDMMKELNVFPFFCSYCSPLVVQDRVFVVTGNGVSGSDPDKVHSPEAPSFAALDKKTGKLLWSSNLPGDRILEGQWTSPAYAVVGDKAQVIFPGGDGWLYSPEPDTGKLIWKFDCNPKSSRGKKTGRDVPNYLLAAPVVYDNRVYIGVGHNPEGGKGSTVGHFWCIDITKTGDVS